MRLASLALLSAGCLDSGFAVSESPGFDGEPTETGALCLAADPLTVSFDGATAPQDRTPVTVIFSVPADCMDPRAQIDQVALDDPFEAFAFDAPEMPVGLEIGATMQVDVSLLAVDPGVVEGQLVVSGMGAFGPGSSTVQLFAEIPEPE